MAGGVASESILFIGAIIAATAMAGVITGVTGLMAEGISQRSEADAKTWQSEVDIINDPGDMDWWSDPTFYLLNSGTTSLATDDIVVVLNGVISQTLTIDVLGSADDEILLPGEVAQIEVTDLAAGSGDHRVRIILGPGIVDDFAWSAP